ncbi:MAG: multidrug ABC transporter ATP-binding protein [Acidobacteria bacterium]|nr:MAG: multidrug ABC transporter ATP-binding protein [Acidobacteriota bacterium]
MTTLVEVKDLYKYYGPIKAVDGISFSVSKGDVLGFMGPNGAGKSTAMKMITGFLDADKGSIEVSGFNLASDNLQARKMIGYLPESAPAYGEMTVTGFLQFIAAARSLDNPKAAIEKVVAMTGLESVVHQNIETLSKGFKRRVGLAQALIHDPEVLILDEPTDGLDPNQKALVQDLISSLSENKCIILSTHILDEVERVCNRALIISEGKILVDSTPAELIEQAPNHNVIVVSLVEENADLLADIESREWCQRLKRHSKTEFEMIPKDGGNYLTELMQILKETELHSVHLQEGRLDDLFRSVTQGVTT